MESLKNIQQTTLWLTGRPCSGKTTLSLQLRKAFEDMGIRAVNLDGDVLRKGLCADLGFSAEDRLENLRRIAHLCQIFNENGNLVIAAFVSPTEDVRCMIRGHIKNFKLCYVKCSPETCEKRDVKGMYKLAREGKIKEFTGISSPFEDPQQAEVVVDTEQRNINQCIEHIFRQLQINVEKLPSLKIPRVASKF